MIISDVLVAVLTAVSLCERQAFVVVIAAAVVQC